MPQSPIRGIRLPACACLIALAGCAGQPAKTVPVDEPPERPEAVVPLPPDPQVDLEYYILAGETALQRGYAAQAAQAYVAALDYSDDPELAQRATRIALFAGDPDLAFRAALAWSEVEPDSADAHQTAARLALRAGAPRQLETHAAAVVDLHPEGPAAGFRELADVLSGEPGAGDVALNAVDELVSGYPDLPEAHYALGLLALRYNRLGAADAAAGRALALRPDWAEAVMLKADVLVRQGRIAAADELVAGLTGSRSERAEHHIEYARLLLDAGRPDAAADGFERALSLDPDNADARYGLGLLALSLDQAERAEKAFAALYRSGRRRDDAAFYLGAVAESRGDYAEARQWYGRVGEGAHLFEAQVRAAATYYEQGDLARARSELQSLRERRGDMAERLYIAEGELLYKAQRYREALALYEEALSRYPGDADLLYARSLVWERLGDIDRAEADLRAVLSQEPGDPRALNALGYMLSNHSRRYEEARRYIEQALEADPDNPVIIDSMGWIHYRLGNLDKALDYLERAYARLPDPEVAAHLGEVLWKLGRKEEARRVWSDAEAEDPDHPVLRETLERLAP
ncbi:hypothetical protein PC39_04422 [Salinisphaera sp. PC39]|uniref:tetratricopeptide repeat protein n=1 Tax=Salinisphaera sp. PC39 TaxID=1304156 RepID=UPI0033401DC6